MKIACIDDQPLEGQEVLSLLRTQCDKYQIPVSQEDYYSSGSAFFKKWQPGMYGIILIDIFLETESGIEIAKTIRRLDYRVQIVFCSSSNEFAAESYDVEANYYLVKPVTPTHMDRMIHHLNLLRPEEDMIELPDGTMLILNSFLYSEYHNHLITIHLKQGKIIKVWSSQSDLIKLTEPFKYILAINPGTLINLKEVKAFKEDSFLMSDGCLLSISRRKKKELVKIYKSYLFDELRRE